MDWDVVRHLTETRERAALARELHDEFGQLLTAAKRSASWRKAFPADGQCVVEIDQATRARAFGPVEGAATYRIVPELLTNTARYAQATTVHLRLATSDGMVHLHVSDDGRGIPPETASSSGSLGLKGVRERAELLGGQVIIDGPGGTGTTVGEGLEVLKDIKRIRPDQTVLMLSLQPEESTRCGRSRPKPPAT